MKRRLEEVEGRRVETVEWGARQLWAAAAMGRQAGHVEQFGPGEDHARRVVYSEQRRHYIMPPLILVRRVVVTYTTAWEPVPGAPPPVKTNMRKPDGWTMPAWAIPPGDPEAAPDLSDQMDPLF